MVTPTPTAVGAPGAGVGAVRVIRQPPLLDRRAQVAELCPETGSTIVCVADAGRSRALAAYLRGVGRAVALMHSFESDAQRTQSWRRAAEGGCIVVGGRIAALAPVPDLRGAVVVDDADEALQEERSPTWHGRDVLYERARRAGVPFVVCSPVPTVEALTMIGDPGGVEHPAPDVEAGGWPRVQVVDRREEPPGSGLLSEALAIAVHHADGPVVCVLNRRGRFRLLVCAACQHLLRWDRPDERPLVCPECGATKLRVLRSGVTRVREELEALVPGAQRRRRRHRDRRRPRRRHRDRYRGRAAPHRGAAAAPGAGRVSRSRPGAARTPLPRRGAGALAPDPRRAAAVRSSPARVAPVVADAHPRSRRRAGAGAGRSRTRRRGRDRVPAHARVPAVRRARRAGGERRGAERDDRRAAGGRARGPGVRARRRSGAGAHIRLGRARVGARGEPSGRSRHLARAGPRRPPRV